MKIANPIYDSVFKHLMEDEEIARGLISRLLGVEILSLAAQGQEITKLHAQMITSDQSCVRIFRIDFAAEIKLADGTVQKVLIELQKAKDDNVIGRFRHYLASHYAKAPPKEQSHLPIIAIYLLGFTLSENLPKVLKIKRNYLNGVTGAVLSHAVKNDFVEQLTHDAVVVQIPLIDGSTETEIERALLVFNQQHQDTENRHLLVLTQDQWSDSLVRAMLRTLSRAATDEETRRHMDAEDELENIINKSEKSEAARQEAVKALEEERRQKEEERRQKEEERRQKEEERRQKEEAIKRNVELEEKIRRLEGR